MSCVGLYPDVGVLEKHTRLEAVPKQLKGLVEAYKEAQEEICQELCCRTHRVPTLLKDIKYDDSECIRG